MTTNNLPTPTSQNTELALKKTKALFELTDRLLAKKPRELMIPEDDSWMYELWAWADKHNVPDLHWVEDEFCGNGGYWKGLPRDKSKLTNLTELNLALNKLSSLPESIGNLTNLTKLDVNSNQLTSLPESIGNLTNLTELDLENNQLTSLPESIGNLTNLSELHLSGNQLTSLPESIGKLTNLRYLYPNANQLTSLPDWIGKLTNLKKLWLGKNQLTPLEKDKVKRLLPNCEVFF